MNYRVEYKTVNEIIDLFSERNKCIGSTQMDELEIVIHPVVAYDLIIVKGENNNTIDILCKDKKTIEMIKYFSVNNIYPRKLTQLYRCFIINYTYITQVINYEEFCKRYNYY